MQKPKSKILARSSRFCIYALAPALALAFGLNTAQASNMGHTPHVRYALLDLDRAKDQLESMNSNGNAELENLRKQSLESLIKATEQVQLLKKYRADHGLRDE